MIIFVFTPFALIAQTPASALEPACKLSGKVIHITDGDTIKILDARNTQYTVRLAGIDAPEKRQAFGNIAKTYLSNAVKLKMVCVDWNKRGRYGRIIGIIYLGEEDINLSLVAGGYAWHYKKYQNQQSVLDREKYAKAEIRARNAALGLWHDDVSIAPWEWRKQKRLAAREKREASLRAASPSP